MNRISIYDNLAIDRLRAELKFDPRRLRALRTAFFKKSRGVDEALAEFQRDGNPGKPWRDVLHRIRSSGDL